jgi:hypothetical protein
MGQIITATGLVIYQGQSPRDRVPRHPYMHRACGLYAQYPELISVATTYDHGS